MLNRLVIIGAGGHGKVVADIALKCGYKNIAFVDDNATGECIGFQIVGTSEVLESLNDGKTDFIIAIGSNQIRKAIAGKFRVNWVTLIHPSAQIGIDVKIGKGTVVMAGAVINISSKIGEHCIINSNAIVEHDNVIGNYVHISPGVSLGGLVSVGDNTHIGIGTTVKNNTAICGDCVIGAGAVVVKDINEKGTYIGVPAVKSK